LLPGLARAKSKALLTNCLNNQKQIGLSFMMYAADFNESFPVHPDWASTGGTNGTYYVFVAATNRPLNQYAKNIDVFHCPADKGDSFTTVRKSCFEDYGNSYLVQWADLGNPPDPGDRTKYYSFRVRTVTAWTSGRPIKSTEIAKAPTRKIIQGDWVWHPNVAPPRRRVFGTISREKTFRSCSTVMVMPPPIISRSRWSPGYTIRRPTRNLLGGNCRCSN